MWQPLYVSILSTDCSTAHPRQYLACPLHGTSLALSLSRSLALSLSHLLVLCWRRTTLHVINSCVIKLGKLHRADRVYRGVAGKTLSKKLRRKDHETNTRGGIEFGFMSCSTQRKEAERYSERLRPDEDATPLIWEIDTGMIDRGADLAWLSQYPHGACLVPSRALKHGPPRKGRLVFPPRDP